MSSTAKNLLLLVAAVLALIGGYWLAQTLRPEPEITAMKTYGGGEMINFTLPELDGKKHSLEEWRGKVIVLNFWATWCPPCREEIPLLIALQKQRAAEGLQVVSVAIDNETAVRPYRQSAGINYPVLMGGDAALDLVARYGNSMGALPFTVIIDRGGAIAVRKLGAFTRKELESLVEPLLSPAKTANSLNS
jgi:thiol-disulfide isomerase/thioredoxin